MAGAWLPAVVPPVHCPGLPLYSQAVFPSPARLACLALLLVRAASAAEAGSAPTPRAVPEDASLRLYYGAAFLRGDARGAGLSVDYEGLTPSDLSASARAWLLADGALGLAVDGAREGFGLYEGGQQVLRVGLYRARVGATARLASGPVRFELLVGYALDQVPGFSFTDAVSEVAWTRHGILFGARVALEEGPFLVEVHGEAPWAVAVRGPESATASSWGVSAGLGLRYAVGRTGPVEWGAMLQGLYTRDELTSTLRGTAHHSTFRGGLALDLRWGSPPVTPAPVVAPDGQPKPDAVAPTTGGLVVTVTNKATGAKLAGVSVKGPAAAVVTDAGGVARLVGLPPGPVSLTLTLTGYLPGAEAAVVVAGLESEAAVALLPEKQRVPATVQGLVRSGQGGAPVQAELEVPEAKLKARADKKGAFSFSVPAGRYTLVITAPGYRAQSKTLTVKDAEQAIFNIDLAPR